MRTRHVMGAAAAGLVLAATGVATSVPAMAATVPQVVAMPSTVDASLWAKKPGGATMKPLKAAKAPKAQSAQKPVKVHKVKHGTTIQAAGPAVGGPADKHPGKKPAKHTSKHGLKPARHAPAAAPPAKAPPAATRPHAPSAVTVEPSAPPPSMRPQLIPNVIQQVAGAVQSAFTLVGWNLLALIPMAGIAFAISRQITSARRSVSRWHTSI